MGSSFPLDSNQASRRKYIFNSHQPSLIIIHQLCQLCVQRQEVVCSGPKGHACDVCWKTKRSCENGGEYLISLLPIPLFLLIVIQVAVLRSKRNPSPLLNPPGANARHIPRSIPPQSGRSKDPSTSTSLHRSESGLRLLRAAAPPFNSTASRSQGLLLGGPRGPPSPTRRRTWQSCSSVSGRNLRRSRRPARKLQRPRTSSRSYIKDIV